MDILKIAFLTPEYPHELTIGLGGIATSVKNLAQGMVSAGCKPVVLVYEQDEDAAFEDSGIQVYKIKNVKVKGISLFLTQRKITSLINRLYSENKIDFIEAPDWTGFTAFVKPRQCPLVIRLHGSDTYFCDIEKRPSKWINRFLERRALKQADAVISVSKFTADYTNRLFKLNREITVIPNGIDLAQFTKTNVVVEPNVILYFGTLIRKKGSLELPHIFNHVLNENPEAKLILVGADSYDIQSGTSSTWHLMQKEFNHKALKQVQYLGRKPYNEMREIIEKAAICVFPSYAEALPVSWIEAMALEKAVVASNIGWAYEVIEDGKEGYLSDPSNHMTYANKINQLLLNKERANIFGVNARKRIEREFSNEVVVQQNLIYYQEFKR